MQFFSERLGRADRRYGRESATAMPRLRSRFRTIQAWRAADGAQAQPIHRASAERPEEATAHAA